MKVFIYQNPFKVTEIFLKLSFFRCLYILDIIPDALLKLNP